MPIHDVGYRPWQGVKSPRIHGWWIMLLTNIMILRRNGWVRRAMAAAWLPTIYLGAGFYTLETALHATDRQSARTFVGMFQAVVPADVIQFIAKDVLTPDDIGHLRHRIWGHLIASFLSYPQALAGMLLIGLIAPALISRDLRTRAYLIYFSKPVGVREYLAGKYLTLIVYVRAITLVPALALFLFGVGLSPDFGVLWDTWDLPIRTVLASLVFLIPTATIALMFSSLTHESRYAAVGWFVFWLLSFASWQTVYSARYLSLQYEVYYEGQLPERLEYLLDEVDSRRQFDEAAQLMIGQYIAKEAGDSVWSLLSMYESIRRVQLWLLSTGQPMPVSHLLMVSCVTLFSFVVLLRRVTAPLRL